MPISGLFLILKSHLTNQENDPEISFKRTSHKIIHRVEHREILFLKLLIKFLLYALFTICVFLRLPLGYTIQRCEFGGCADRTLISILRRLIEGQMIIIKSRLLILCFNKNMIFIKILRGEKNEWDIVGADHLKGELYFFGTCSQHCCEYFHSLCHFS